MLRSAVNILDNAVKSFGNKIAIEDDKTAYTYSEYQRLAKNLGAHLSSTCRKGFIGVYLPKSCKSLISFMGILYNGSAYVPLDINMPAVRLAKIVNHLNPAAIITDSQHAEKLISEIDVPKESIVIFDDGITSNEKNISDILAKAVENIIDTDPIYVMYTSGSTGMPKGVVIPHRGVIDYAHWVLERFELNEDTIFGNQAPFHFDNSVLDIYASMLCGGKLRIIPEVLFNFPVKLPEFILKNKINLIFWVPTVLINVANSGVLSEINLDCLKKVLFCGEVMPNKQLNIWRKTQNHIFYANLYGPTEITDVCTYYVVDKEFEDNEPLPIGIPCENTKALILTEDDREANIDEIGELCILGTGLALGYYKEPEITAKAFMQNPLNTGYKEIIYRTGDLVFKDSDGLIIYLGRKDSQIKHKGNRIELGEIEVIAQSLDEIENACVLYDEINSKIIMFAETASDEKKILKEMRKYLQPYMIPSEVIKMDKIPLNANGKLDRVYLRNNFLGK